MRRISSLELYFGWFVKEHINISLHGLSAQLNFQREKRDEVFCLHFIYIARKWEFSRDTSNVPEFFKDLLIIFLNFKILKSLTYVSKFHVHHLIKNYLTINLRLTINHYFLFSIVNVSIKL